MSRDLIDVAALRELIREVVREELPAAIRRALAERDIGQDGYVSTRDAAQLASVAQGTIRRWIREEKLEEHHAGRELRVRRSDLKRLLDGRGSADPLTPEEMADRDFG